MPAILETISWILTYLNVGGVGLIVGYGIRFVYSAFHSKDLKKLAVLCFFGVLYLIFSYSLVKIDACSSFKIHQLLG